MRAGRYSLPVLHLNAAKNRAFEISLRSLKYMFFKKKHSVLMVNFCGLFTHFNKTNTTKDISCMR